ncbi:hypothetical protein [Streptomyces chartreusis]|uniref:hypothetical protein n=1 Tax=Streptomyces chartreusis TaxID=1969 RepID=UPI00366699EE
MATRRSCDRLLHPPLTPAAIPPAVDPHTVERAWFYEDVDALIADGRLSKRPERVAR